jgi:DNA-binding GntR family transcriptional regulator
MSETERLSRYLDVANDLLGEIEAGIHPVGSRLPTEVELCQRFDVSRATVREALRTIEEAGLIERRQGSGTTVVALQSPVRYVLSVTSETDILRYAADTVLEWTGPSDRVSHDESRRLLLGDPSAWVRWKGVRRERLGGPPLGLTTVYLPGRFTAHVEGLQKAARQAIFAEITAHYGLSLTRIDQDITATVLASQEAEELRAEPGAPALVITRRYYCDQIGVIEVAENIHPADRFRYALQLLREPTTRKRSINLVKPAEDGDRFHAGSATPPLPNGR